MKNSRERKWIIILTAIAYFSMNNAQGQNVYVPPTYQPQPMPNYSILQNSLRQNEERTNAATQSYAELMKVIGETMVKLSNDVETRKWYKEFTDDMVREVNIYRNAGDYAGMNNQAMKCIAKLKSDSELLGRIQTYEEYKRIVQSIQQRPDLTLEEKNNWIAKYPYKFVPMYYNGEIIGGRNWLEVGGPDNTPVIMP